jgi:outer membrane immunogenic protein
VGGGQVGIQGQSGNWVLGAEGTWSATSLNQTQSSAILANINGPFQRSMKIDQIATVTGKLGYAWSDMLFYGKAGYAGARMKTSSDDLIGITSNASAWGNGATAGVGVDYKLYNNFILGFELDYYSVPFRNVSAGTNPPGFTVSYNNGQASIYEATARLSYLFNWGR